MGKSRWPPRLRGWLVVPAGCVTGAVAQLGYGVLALLQPHRARKEAPYELLWAIVNLGMAAGVLGLALLLMRTHPRTVVIGAAIAVAAHLARALVAVLDERAWSEPVLNGSIVGMFVGMGVLAGATLHRRLWAGRRSWLPAATVGAGLVTATFYSIDMATHFVPLGLLWGVPWLLLGVAIRQRAIQSDAAHCADELHASRRLKGGVRW